MSEERIKALFARESGAGYLLLGLVIVSMVLIGMSRATRLLDPLRGWLLTVLTPVTVIAESPWFLGQSVSETFAVREQLMRRNAVLEKENLELSHLAQQYRVLRAENDRLLALVGSRARLPSEVLAAEIIGVVPTPNALQVIIDKGSNDGVAEGNAVIDSEGLFGQVIEMGLYTSQVLLVSDKDHAVPVEVNRNAVRSIAGGTGRIDRLELEFVPVTTDIRAGDLLVTSGLGGRFPRGYPVGTVREVTIDPNATFAMVDVLPAARLDRSRHVLVVFGAIPPAPSGESQVLEATPNGSATSVAPDSASTPIPEPTDQSATVPDSASVQQHQGQSVPMSATQPAVSTNDPPAPSPATGDVPAAAVPVTGRPQSDSVMTPDQQPAVSGAVPADSAPADSVPEAAERGPE